MSILLGLGDMRIKYQYCDQLCHNMHFSDILDIVISIYSIFFKSAFS